ncbi:MAG: mechanosensitive ion channel family protein [Flavobacteriales bacterium]|nr:mechanosensitive ion channel family protein [Flavobacteriales bacterium]
MEQITTFFQTWLHNAVLERLAFIAIGIVAVVVVTTLIKRVVNTTIKNTDHRYSVRKAVNFIGYVLIGIVLLIIYGDKLGNLGVALGLAGAGITFALQEVIVSFAGWLSIILSGTPSVGQRVKIGDAKGDIIDIGVMRTTIMEMGDWVEGDLYNGRIITLANSYVFKEKIHNYSAEYPFLWDEVKVPIRTESDHELARKVFSKVVNDVCEDYAIKSEKDWKRMAYKFRVEQANVRPSVRLKFDENWITFTLRYIVDYKSRGITKDKIFTALLNEIAKHDNITIATTTSEVTSVVKRPEA